MEQSEQAVTSCSAALRVPAFSATRRRARFMQCALVAARCTRAALAASIAVLAAGAPVSAQPCVGDCNVNGAVEINELILGVNIALDAADVSECPNLDDGQGVVTIARLIAAVNNALCGCAGCLTPGPSATPTPTGGTVTPTGTPTGGVIVSTWTVDNYEVQSSDCNDLIEDGVVDGLEAGGSEFIVRQMGEMVEIEDEEGTIYEGTAEPDGTIRVQQSISDSIFTCEYEVDVEAAANLANSPTTAIYEADVDLSGFCVGLSDCSLRITSRWRRLESNPARN